MKRIRLILMMLVLSLILGACASKEKEVSRDDTEKEQEEQEERSSRKKKKNKKKKEKEAPEETSRPESVIPGSAAADENRVFSVCVTVDDDSEITDLFGDTFIFVNDYEYPELNKALYDWCQSSDEESYVLIKRSDKNFLSFVENYGDPEDYDEEEDFYDPGYSIFVGHNYFTATGEEAVLRHVVTDVELFKEKLLEQISTEYGDENGPFYDDIVKTVDEAVGNGSEISNEEFSWSVGYEGMTVYMNPRVNFNYSDSGDFSSRPFFIPYKGNEELFAPIVYDVPNAYMSQIIAQHGFGDTLIMDPFGDGEGTSLFIYADYDEDSDLFSGISTYYDGPSAKVTFDPTPVSPNVWYVKTSDDNTYLVIQSIDKFRSHEEITISGLSNAGQETLDYHSNIQIKYDARLDTFGETATFDPDEFILINLSEEEDEDGYTYEERTADLYMLGSSAKPQKVKRQHIELNPVSTDNFRDNEGDKRYFTIKDNNGDKEYIIDADTKLRPWSSVDIPGYEAGKDIFEWLDGYYYGDPSSGLAFGMGDVFDLIVDGDHVDEIRGIYWWD